MSLSPELSELLAVALRSRARSVQALASVAGSPVEDVRDSIHTLQRAGYVEVNDDQIAYRRPEIPVSDTSRRTLDEVIRGLTQASQELDQTLESLPALIQAWDVGGAQERTISGEIMHAQAGPGEAWMAHFVRDTPQACQICLPDLAPLLASPRNDKVADWTSVAMGALQVQLVIADANARDPDLAPALERIREHGTEIRSHPAPPSFFWASDRTTTGLPLHWGEAWPSTVLTVRSEPVAEAMAARFEQIWSAASPIGNDARDWEPMLVLMNDGMTMDAAGARLGLARRTARRRVAAAMRHYGVQSQFSLGAAWGRDQQHSANAG